MLQYKLSYIYYYINSYNLFIIFIVLFFNMTTCCKSNCIFTSTNCCYAFSGSCDSSYNYNCGYTSTAYYYYDSCPNYSSSYNTYKSSSSTINVDALIGGIIGGTFFLFLFIFMIVFCLRRRLVNQQNGMAANF